MLFFSTSRGWIARGMDGMSASCRNMTTCFAIDVVLGWRQGVRLEELVAAFWLRNFEKIPPVQNSSHPLRARRAGEAVPRIAAELLHPPDEPAGVEED